MTAFYDRLEATAKRLIRDKGFAATLRRDGAATGPAHNPQPGADVTFGCLVVETGYVLTDRAATSIEQGDKLGLISTELDTAPVITDRLTIDGEDFHFVALEPLRPGGQALLYEFHARR